MRYVTSFLAFTFGAFALSLNSGYSWGPAGLLICAIISALWQRSPRLLIPGKDDAWITAAFLLFFMVALAEVALHGSGSSELDKPSRFLFALVVLAFLNRYPPSPAWLWVGIALGATGGGLIGVYHVFVQGMPRAGGSMNPIQFGNLSILLGLLSMCAIFWQKENRTKNGLLTAFFGLSVILGILGALLSGSRGGWLALLVVPIVLIGGYIRQFRKKSMIAGLVALTVAVSTLVGLAGDIVEQRIDNAAAEFEAYQTHNDASSSVGVRLELWKSAWLLGSSKPLLGWGTNGITEGKQQLIEAGKVKADVLRFSHAHNDYLDLFQKRGVPGLASMLALYLLPMVAFIREIRHQPDQRSMAFAGLATVICYAIFSLTQAFLEHNSGAMVYAFSIVLLWTAHKSAVGTNEPSLSSKRSIRP
ncbi:O-antigen ligase family protein [Marinobacter sp.]|uniref:O-antigen ligase family protein n=1 Tax=Marinobacter sp. TaxID=50741 RepID=UPI003567CF4E